MRYLGCWVVIVKSSAYEYIVVLGKCGSGMSLVKRLKRVGERMAPWGTPFWRCFVLDLWL